MRGVVVETVSIAGTSSLQRPADMFLEAMEETPIKDDEDSFPQGKKKPYFYTSFLFDPLTRRLLAGLPLE